MRQTTNLFGHRHPIHPTRGECSRAILVGVIAFGLSFLSTAHANAQLVLSKSSATFDGVEVGQSWQVSDSLLRSSDPSIRIDVLDTSDAGEVRLLVTHGVPRPLFPQGSQFSFGGVRVSTYSVTVWLGKVVHIGCQVIDSSDSGASFSLDDAKALAIARHGALQESLRLTGCEVRPPFRRDADFQESEASPLGMTVAGRQLSGAHFSMVVTSRRSFQSFLIRIFDEAAYARISKIRPRTWRPRLFLPLSPTFWWDDAYRKAVESLDVR